MKKCIVSSNMNYLCRPPQATVMISCETHDAAKHDAIMERLQQDYPNVFCSEQLPDGENEGVITANFTDLTAAREYAQYLVEEMDYPVSLTHRVGDKIARVSNWHENIRRRA